MSPDCKRREKSVLAQTQMVISGREGSAWDNIIRKNTLKCHNLVVIPYTNHVYY
jgi:hypothetical protein